MKITNKEKPAYTIWQNSVYVIKKTWERDKLVLADIAAQIILSVAASITALFLPKTVISQIIGGAPVNMLIFTIIAFTVTTMLLKGALHYCMGAFQFRRTALRAKVGEDILFKIITTDYVNLEDKSFNDGKQIADEITEDSNSSTEQIYHCFTDLFINLFGFIIYILLLAAVNPLILLITVATSILGVFVRRWASNWQHGRDMDKAVINKRLWYINNIGPNYKMAKDIRLFAMTGWLRDVYGSFLNLSDDLNKRVQLKFLAADAADCAAIFLREGIAYAYLIWQVLSFNLPVGQFVLLFAAIGGFSGWILGILNEYFKLCVHSLNYCRLRAFLEYPDTFLHEAGEQIVAEKGRSYILELKNVSFRYSGAKENALENINLTIYPGEKLAVVGLNGAGKTTLVKLLCGFYDPTNGQVLLNGKDIRTFNRKQYYTLFTAVFQEFNILPLSIAENVSQLAGEEIDRNRLKKCLRSADIYDKIITLPDGADSMLIKNVNEDAAELSGGETQKLMLARALYKDSPILILDEPTAALDPIAENKLYNRYNELSAGKTAVFISHRLASTRFCDRIILLNGKTITECGTHDMLMRLNGSYAELFEIQSRYYKDEAVEMEA